MSQYTHILIDGNNLGRKNFYTHRDFHTVVDGEHVKTGAVYGSLISLVAIRRNWLKDNGTVIVVWDRGYKRKLEIYPDYKRKRREGRDKEEYENYTNQIKLLEKILKHTSFHSAFARGEEADDVIATLSVMIRMRSKNSNILIVSSDKDMYQLVNPRVHQMVISKQGKEQVYGPREIKKVSGVQPLHYLAIQLMTGDAGDGVPGVKGIGPKTALKILSECSKKEIESLINPDGIEMPKALIKWLRKKGRIANRGSENYWTIFFNMTLKLLKPSMNVNGLKILRGTKNENRLTDLFVKYDFGSLLKGGKIRSLL